MATNGNQEITPIFVPFPESLDTPDKISPDTDATHVRLYVHQLLLEAQPGFNEETAWQWACKVIGSGRQVLQYREEQWTLLLGEYGILVFNAIEDSKTYAKDSVWRYLHLGQKTILGIAFVIYGFNLSKSNNLDQTKQIGLVYLVYTGFTITWYKIASLEWYANSSKIPDFFKIQPARPGESPWEPSLAPNTSLGQE